MTSIDVWNESSQLNQNTSLVWYNTNVMFLQYNNLTLTAMCVLMVVLLTKALCHMDVIQSDMRILTLLRAHLRHELNLITH